MDLTGEFTEEEAKAFKALLEGRAQPTRPKLLEPADLGAQDQGDRIIPFELLEKLRTLSKEERIAFLRELHNSEPTP